MKEVCALAPLGMRCKQGNGRQTMECCCHSITAAILQIEQIFPFVGHLIPDYQCPDFEPEDGEYEKALIRQVEEVARIITATVEDAARAVEAISRWEESGDGNRT